MEEDIKILENIKKFVEIEFKHYITDRELKAIENLIKGYRELKESIKQLDKLTFEFSNEVAREYIPKSKIKEKIEELEKENEQTYTKFLASDRANANLGTKGKMIEGAILVLQELMEDK